MTAKGRIGTIKSVYMSDNMIQNLGQIAQNEGKSFNLVAREVLELGLKSKQKSSK